MLLIYVIQLKMSVQQIKVVECSMWIV